MREGKNSWHEAGVLHWAAVALIGLAVWPNLSAAETTAEAFAISDAPPSTLIKTIVAAASVKQFASDPFDPVTRPVVTTPLGVLVRADEGNLVTSQAGQELITPWKSMSPESFFAIASALLPTGDLNAQDALLVYALNRKQIKPAREMADRLQKLVKQTEQQVQSDTQKLYNSGTGFTQEQSMALQEAQAKLARSQALLSRRMATLRQLEAAASPDGLSVDAKPRTVEDIDAAFAGRTTITLPVIADAGVQAGGKKDENLGKSAILEVKNYEDTPENGWVLQRAYLKFNLLPVQGQKVTGLWLAVYGNLGDGDKPVTVDVRPLTAEQNKWDEMKITWKSQPEVKAEAIGRLIFDFGKTETRATEGRWYVTGDLKPWFDKERGANAFTASLQLATDTKEEACFFTKESAKGRKFTPRLIVEYESQDVLQENWGMER